MEPVTDTSASKPRVLSPDLVFLAAHLGELRERRQWVCWRLDRPEVGKDKWRKVPVTPSTRRAAKANDPSTWASFEDAADWYLEHPQQLAGVGYIFSKDDPYCGVDLDRCLDSAGTLAAWAEPIVKSFDTYIERSPSATGLKLFCRGSLPIDGTGRRSGQVEAYHHGRYFTVTGLPYRSSEVEINDCQPALDQLWMCSFSDKSKDRQRDFEKLFSGDWSSFRGRGEQSSADLALCSRLASRVGPHADRIDAMFRRSGLMRPKWDERHSADGFTYGQLTIQKALEGRPASSPGSGKTGNFLHARPTIVVDPESTPVEHTLAEITAQLLSTKSCYRRADQLVTIDKDVITPVLSPAELAGRLNQVAEVYFVERGAGRYKPLPPSYGSTWLWQPSQRERLPRLALFTRNPVFTDDFRLITPGYDADSGIYYAGPHVAPREGTEHLDRLLQDFCFKSVGDRTNYLGMLLTIVLVPHFLGSKPAALFNGNQPQLGKSILAQIIAILRDGNPVETASYNPNDEEFEKRMGSLVRRGVTTIIVDNAKSRGRNPRIDSACLERSITDPILSFRLLGSSSDIRAENSHVFCITANSAEVSRDLITRSVVINMHYEGNPERRSFTIVDPEGYAIEHRGVLLGELIGMVERWKRAGKSTANVASRFNKRGWGSIVGGILEVRGEPDFLANAQEAATQLDETRREFTELVGVLVRENIVGWMMPSDMARVAADHGLLAAELGAESSRSRATRMGILVGSFVGEHFDLPGAETAVFLKRPDRKGNLYRAEIVTPTAER